MINPQERKTGMKKEELNPVTRFERLLGFLLIKYGKRQKVEPTSHVAEVRDNDYHHIIPTDSNIREAGVRKDGTRYVNFKDGSATWSYKHDGKGYIPDLLMAKRLAEKGDPTAEFYFDRAASNYAKMYGESLCFSEGNASDLRKKIIDIFRDTHKNPSGSITDLTSGIIKVNEATGVCNFSRFADK